MFVGVAVNAIAVIVGSVLGRYAVSGINERFKTIIQQSQGLFVIFIGVSGALDSKYVLVMILSLLIGCIIGEAIDIDKRMNHLGEWAGRALNMGQGNFSKGFVTSSILFCSGSMAVIGAMQSGLSGNHNMLFLKAVLDGTFAIFMTSTLGIGVLFSFVPILVYEGLIAVGAGLIGVWLDATTITEMSAAGSLLLVGIGFNLLGLKQIKIANMIPAIFMPWPLLKVYDMVYGMIY
jgi:uncharacterized membrane protein YqgA involved in biofilm formation